jgi:hypothetical protein
LVGRSASAAVAPDDTRQSAIGEFVRHLCIAALETKLRIAATGFRGPARFQPAGAPEREDVAIFALRRFRGGVKALLKVLGGECLL